MVAWSRSLVYWCVFWSHIVFLEMGKKEQQLQPQKDHKDNDRGEAVLELLRKHAPLTVKQVGFSYFHCFMLLFLRLNQAIFHCLHWTFFYSTAIKFVTWFSFFKRIILLYLICGDLFRDHCKLTSLIYDTINWQEKFCNNACVERFLRAKGDNVKKAAKHLRACLSWRESIGTGTITLHFFSHLLLFLQKVFSICLLILSFLQAYFLFVSLC
jgi:hypothetical protein